MISKSAQLIPVRGAAAFEIPVQSDLEAWKRLQVRLTRDISDLAYICATN